MILFGVEDISVSQLKGGLSSVWISWGLWFMIGHEQLRLFIMGNATGVLATEGIELFSFITIGRLIIFLILLTIGWNMSTCVRMTHVKPFLYQITYSSYAQKSKCSIYVYHWMC